MKNSHLCYICLILLQTTFFAGCAHILPPPTEQPLARQIADSLRTKGDAISQFKCLAHVRMESMDQVLSGRAAIAVVAPDKLRVEWLNMMGQPFLSFLADGKNITVVSRSDGKVHRLRQSAGAMETLVHIPIGIEDLQRILVGSIPLREHAFFLLDQMAENEAWLTLRDRWHNVIASIKVNQADSRVQAMKVFDRQGDLQYAVQWMEWRHIDRYDLPAKVAFESENRQRLVLTVERFWPNADVPPSTFVLEGFGG